MKNVQPLSKQKPFERGAGILLPITSLPSPYGIGTFGRQAYKFVDFLVKAGQSYWQVLPLGPTSYGDSPYQSFSAFAGNPYFIDLDVLTADGLIKKSDYADIDWYDRPDSVNYAKIYEGRFGVLKKAFAASNIRADVDFQKFCEENDTLWLDDYSLYMSVKLDYGSSSWLDWPEEIRMAKPETISACREKYAEDMLFWKFCQYEFYKQWRALKAYANERGIQIIGDIPIYVSLDSADVWLHPELFLLDKRKLPTDVSGVPPDAFSKTGQLWGNPLYDWDKMAADDFLWWRKRMECCAGLYDVVRIDHFIGIVRYYAVPYGETTAMHGEWRKGPGRGLVSAVKAAMGGKKIIAEDLGCVVPAVTKLRVSAGFPGMKILEFAFDSGPDNTNLPCHFDKNCFVYGGTHDNETLRGYFAKRTRKELRFARNYLGVKKNSELAQACIRAGFASAADTAVFQMQDYLGLGNEARMNFPSTLGGNWLWRMTDDQMSEDLANGIRTLTEIYARLPKKSMDKRGRE